MNTRDLGFINFNNEEMQFVKFNGTIVYEAWKNLMLSKIPPLTLPKCKGVPLLDYKIYGDSVQDGTPTPETPIEVESVGEKTKNLVDASFLTNGQVNGNNGTINYNVTNFLILDKYTEINENTKYTISAKTNDKTLTYWFIYFDKNFNFIFISNMRVHTSPENAKYVKIQIAYTDKSVISKEDVYNIQLEEGTIVTDYEPYGYKIPIKASNDTEEIITNIYLNEPLRKVGDYADYIDFENGKVVRNIGKVVLDGSETDWVYQSNLSRFYKPITDSNPLNKRTPIISNRFISNTSNIQEEGIGFIHSSKIYLYCSTNITSITSFQTWLSTHNTEVVYELATPTEETIDLPNIPTHKGTTIIEVDTSILPSNMEVTYKGKEV